MWPMTRILGWRRLPTLIRWFAAFVIFGIALALRFTFGPLHEAARFLIFYPAIIMAAVLLGWKEAIFVLVLSLSVGWYFGRSRFRGMACRAWAQHRTRWLSSVPIHPFRRGPRIRPSFGEGDGNKSASANARRSSGLSKGGASRLTNRLVLALADTRSQTASSLQQVAADSPLEGGGFELSVPCPWRGQLECSVTRYPAGYEAWGQAVDRAFSCSACHSMEPGVKRRPIGTLCRSSTAR